MKNIKIKAKAAQLLACNLELETIYMTSDGLGYSRESIAEANQNGIDASKKVLSFGRDILKDPAGDDTGDDTGAGDNTETSLLDLSVDKLKAALDKVIEPTELEKLLEAEKAKGNDARSTAIEAIEKRIQVVADATQD